jgi:hypothetical protein
MEKTLSLVSDAIQTLTLKVKDYVKENGGFIKTTNADCTTMYAYVLNYCENRVEEFVVNAIKVEDDELLVLLTPLSIRYELGNDDVVGSKEDWHAVNNYEDILIAPTIISIAECIEEYVKLNK